MGRAEIFLALLLFCPACSTPDYVLHSRPPTKFRNFLKPPKENTKIASTGGVVLLYDRDRWVVSERGLENGSAWVHYAINVKNTTDQAVTLDMSNIRLEDAAGAKAAAAFEKSDQLPKWDVAEGKSLYRITVKFHAPKEMVSRHGGSSDPIDLVVPIRGKGELRQRVWLWEE